MTVPTALRVLLRWSWLIVVLGLAGAAAGLILSARQHKTFQASSQVSYVQYVPGKDSRTNVPIPAPEPLRTTADWSLAMFQDPSVAKQAANHVGGISATRLLAGLRMTPITVTEVKLSYTASSQSAASNTLNAYLTAFFDNYTQTLYKSISTSQESAASQIATLQASHPSPLSGAARTIAQLKSDQTTMENLRQTLSSQLGFSRPSSATVQSKPIPKPVAMAGGGLAGVAGGILLVLVASRMRGQVGDRSEIEELGVRVVEVDTSDSADPLRLELDVLGVGRGLRVVSVSPAAGAEASTGVGLALARAYADVGVSVLLITADSATPSRADLPGLAEFLENGAAPLKPYTVSPNLAWVPPGRLRPDSSHLFTSGSISRLLNEARRLAHVIVIETGPVNDQPEAALPIACSDAAVVVMLSHRTSRAELGDALREASRVAPRMPLVCMDYAEPNSAEVVPRVSAPRQTSIPVLASRALDVPGES
jgi:Mrp family chromosome partitioning ATPase